jgi:hypothetical protein
MVRLNVDIIIVVMPIVHPNAMASAIASVSLNLCSATS